MEDSVIVAHSYVSNNRSVFVLRMFKNKQVMADTQGIVANTTFISVGAGRVFNPSGLPVPVPVYKNQSHPLTSLKSSCWAKKVLNYEQPQYHQDERTKEVNSFSVTRLEVKQIFK